LSADECSGWISRATAKGFEPMGERYPGGYRDNDRLVLDHPAWAAELFRRLEHLLPVEHLDAEGERWRLRGLNSRFRFCRYRGGQSFTRHQDGAWTSPSGERSWLTCQLYLNDASEFEGGETRFYAGRSPEAALDISVTPEAGMALVFDHQHWHDGAPVPRGTKYVMRTDVMFERVSRQPAAQGHRGYVWCALVRNDGSLVTGSRDTTILQWPSMQRLTGHSASVTALAEDARGRLWSGSRDATVRRWSGETSEVVGAHHGAVLSLTALGEQGVLSTGADGLLALWSLDGARLAEAGGFEGWVWCAARLDARRVVAGSEDGMLRVWRVDGGLSTERVIPVGSPIRAVAVSNEGLVAAGTERGEVLLFRGTDWQLLRRAHLHAAPVTALAFFPGGRLASGAEDDCARVSRDLKVLSTLPHPGFVRTVAVLPSGALVTGGYDGTVRTWLEQHPDEGDDRQGGEAQARGDHHFHHPVLLRRELFVLGGFPIAVKDVPQHVRAENLAL
jgi:WD40 repeat protein